MLLLDHEPRLAAMDAVVVLHGRLRPPKSGGLFFSLSEKCWWCACCGASSPHVSSLCVGRTIFPIPRLAPFGGRWDTRFILAFSDAKHPARGKCANSTASCSLPGRWP